MSYTLNICSVACQRHLNKIKKKKTEKVMRGRPYSAELSDCKWGNTWRKGNRLIARVPGTELGGACSWLCDLG